MAQSETRPGFRLPWTSEPAQAVATVADDPAIADEAAPADDATEAAVATQAEEATQTAATPAEEPDPVTTQTFDATAVAGTRRPTKFMAEMSRAMQGAAETARDETLARLAADLKTVVEEIQAAATVEAAELRRRADDDVASVRDWSKAEIARIREETEGRIAARKRGLDTEIEAHTETIGARVDHVGATVTEYEAVMAAFFERLKAEHEPSRIAAMAEQMPDPPDLTTVAATISGPTDSTFQLRAALVALTPLDPETADVASYDDGSDENGPDFEAAEAEATALIADTEPETVVAASEHDADPARLAATDDDAPMGERTTTRVVVVGLVSVASIATFKRSLGRVHGVSAIGVASGPDGEFVFTVSHGSNLALSEAITGLPGFEAQVTAESASGLQVTAHDPDTGA
jgi:hypothetical protein